MASLHKPAPKKNVSKPSPSDPNWETELVSQLFIKDVSYHTIVTTVIQLGLGQLATTLQVVYTGSGIDYLQGSTEFSLCVGPVVFMDYRAQVIFYTSLCSIQGQELKAISNYTQLCLDYHTCINQNYLLRTQLQLTTLFYRLP